MQMRLDYTLYAISIIFFILAAIAAVVTPPSDKLLWVAITAILGVIFALLGYSQTPKKKEAAPPVAAVAEPAPQPIQPPPAVQVSVEAVKETAEKVAEKVAEAGTALTTIKGIGGKRAEMLKAVGINTVEELAEASAEDLAAKLKVSPKFTEKWIENARKLVKKT
jgi:predicted flap endonuclease-1-like 5' DNA nuclease